MSCSFTCIQYQFSSVDNSETKFQKVISNTLKLNKLSVDTGFIKFKIIFIKSIYFNQYSRTL